MKRIIALLISLLMILSMVACVKDEAPAGDAQPPIEDNPPATDEVPASEIIDIYLIAGQSNAVGHTKFYNSPDFAQYAAYLNSFAPELVSGGAGFPYIHYAGNSRKDQKLSDGSRELINQDKPWQEISLGLGSNENNIGPEVGMAKALSKYYNETTGRSAGIIKFAHGGTSIRNGTTGSNSFGNWVSPSYAQHLGLSYNDTDITGGLYRGLLEQVSRNISELYEYGGYTQINIRGLYWMQGESDRTAPAQYKDAFTYFVSDLRRDLSALMLEFTDGESDLGASEMGIFIGGISKGYNLTSAVDQLSNDKFILMQQNLAKEIENCYFVNTSKYIITEFNTATGAQKVLGSDAHHWNAQDMLNIGNDVGKMMFDKCVKNAGK